AQDRILLDLALVEVLYLGEELRPVAGKSRCRRPPRGRWWRRRRGGGHGFAACDADGPVGGFLRLHEVDSRAVVPGAIEIGVAVRQPRHRFVRRCSLVGRMRRGDTEYPRRAGERRERQRTPAMGPPVMGQIVQTHVYFPSAAVSCANWKWCPSG